MNEAEKTTFGVTLAAHEELLTAVLTVLFAQKTPEERQALLDELGHGPDLKPEVVASWNLNIDAADRFAGVAIEYHEVLSRICRDAAERAGR